FPVAEPDQQQERRRHAELHGKAHVAEGNKVESDHGRWLSRANVTLIRGASALRAGWMACAMASRICGRKRPISTAAWPENREATETAMLKVARSGLMPRRPRGRAPG